MSRRSETESAEAGHEPPTGLAEIKQALTVVRAQLDTIERAVVRMEKPDIAKRRRRRAPPPTLPDPSPKVRWLLELFPLHRESLMVRQITERAWLKRHGEHATLPDDLSADPMYGKVRDLLRRAKEATYVEQPRHGDYRLTEAAERLLRPPVKRSSKAEGADDAGP